MKKNYKKADAATKVRIIEPILKDWNDIIEDNWIIVKAEYNNKTCFIRRESRKGRLTESFHGSLLTELAGILNAYEWSWSVYFDEQEGFEIII